MQPNKEPQPVHNPTQVSDTKIKLSDGEQLRLLQGQKKILVLQQQYQQQAQQIGQQLQNEQQAYGTTSAIDTTGATLLVS